MLEVFFHIQVHEAIIARHCDMKVFAFSLVTNRCVTEYDTAEEGEVMFTKKLAVKMNFLYFQQTTRRS